MENTNKHVIAEQAAQNGFWFTYRAANVFAFLFICIIAGNGHDFTAFAALIVQIIVNLIVVPKRIEQFAERLKHVTFKTQLMNVYITTLSPDQPDDQVTATFNRTIDYLKHVGNTHGVKVHLIMFHDVNIFTKWIDPNGRVQFKSTPRPEGCTWQTFDEYLIDVDDFKRRDREDRLRELRKDNTGFTWVNENVFDQTTGK